MAARLIRLCELLLLPTYVRRGAQRHPPQAPRPDGPPRHKEGQP